MNTGPQAAQRSIAFILRWGSFLAAGLFLVGLVWLLADRDLPIQVGPPMPLAELPDQLALGNPYALLQLAVLVLLVTPLLRLVAAAIAFWRAGEPRYTLIGGAVLLIVVVSLLLARAVG
ncbi:MAG: DUF1634 domain-containing protein [Terriglobia bacterium]